MIEDAREDSPLPPDENDTRFIEPIADPAIRDVLGTFWKTICKGVKEQAESSARIEEKLDKLIKCVTTKKRKYPADTPLED
ncbi:hypothetical protein FRX31_002015 [Thalictrum thalictroides]|uniref:Uncharacterized protein n=1 Tax=Thalictrum thalictroides TaxID=46969 RepID=A0A7J6XFS5_THATH|nr:hypothetical protein FRX31_002015 [Thalictrum thalictroides]